MPEKIWVHDLYAQQLKKEYTQMNKILESTIGRRITFQDFTFYKAKMNHVGLNPAFLSSIIQPIKRGKRTVRFDQQLGRLL